MTEMVTESPQDSRQEGASPDLAELPLEVLEGIARHCSLADRVALTSCCRGLWARPDVHASAGLWGRVRLRGSHSPTSPPSAFSLAIWLARRMSAVQCLQLGPGLGNTAHLLISFGSGGRLQALALCQKAPPWAEEKPALPLLHRLPHLTCLELSSSNLQCPLAVAAALGPLRVLRLHREQAWSRAGEAGFEPLRCLAALTSLQFSQCGLERLPCQLSALSALAELVVSGNPLLGLGLGASNGSGSGTNKGSESPFVVLPVLAPSLSRLGLDSCGLSRLLAELSALRALAELSLDDNASLGDNAAKFEGGAAVFLPLARLAASASSAGLLRLTRLSLRGCNLEVAPAALTCLSSLRELCMSGNPFWMGGRATFQPLRRLHALRRLELAECGLHSLPPQLAELGAALEELDIQGNPLGEAGEGGLRVLWGLGALRRVDVRRCDLQGCPLELGALLARGVKVAWQ